MIDWDDIDDYIIEDNEDQYAIDRYWEFDNE